MYRLLLELRRLHETDRGSFSFKLPPKGKGV